MNRIMILRLALASWMLAACTADDSPSVEPHASCDQTGRPDSELRTQLQEGVDKIHSSGVIGVVAHARDGEDCVDVRSGYAQQGSVEPIAFESRFRMASNTKTFVAVVLLQLVDEGKVRLEDTVDQWLPGLVSGHGNDGKKVTIRHLLQHTSGLYNHTRDILYEFTEQDYHARGLRHYDPEQLIAMAMSHEPNFAPGTGWSYANTNYTLAGMIIEKATGHPWSREVGARILEPLQLSQTSDPGDWPDLPAPHARAHHEFSTGAPLVDVTRFNMSWGGAAASLISTTENLSRFWRALQGGKLLSPARMAEMHETVLATTFQALIPGTRAGLGIFWTPTRCGGYWNHGGDTIGFTTRNAVNDDGTRVVILSENTTSHVPATLQARVKDDLQLLENAMCAGTSQAALVGGALW